MNERSEREVAIFTAALKLPEQEREAFLERRCGDDESLRRRLGAILRAYDQLGNFLEEPPTEAPSSEKD